MIKQQKIKIILYLTLVLAVSISIYAVSTHQLDLTGTMTTPESTELHNITIKITSDTWSLSHTYKSTKTLNVYTLLNHTAELYDFSIKKSYFSGYDSFFIESINNITNGENNRYWQYFVNDQYADKGCNTYFLNDNDKVEWIFQKSPY